MYYIHPLILAVDKFVDLLKNKVVAVAKENEYIFSELRTDEYLEKSYTLGGGNIQRLNEKYLDSEDFIADLTFIAGTLVHQIDRDAMVKFLVCAIKHARGKKQIVPTLRQIMEGLTITKGIHEEIQNIPVLKD